ncbi:hypothetical protein SDJN02_22734, partial [Cucurbita argyrosperma subsp. argyrosperma]
MKTNRPLIAAEPAMNLGDVCDEICSLIREGLRVVAARQTNEEHNSKFNQFFVCQPPWFGEDTGPLVAKRWVLGLENIFDCIGCSDEQKVSFACLRLKDSALSWWIVSKRYLNADGAAVTWEKFKDLFYKRYFPSWLKHEKHRELWKLGQRKQNRDEYDEEFITLSSLVSELNPDDSLEARLFYEGLRPDISRQLCFTDNVSYSDLRNSALLVEQCLNRKDV